MAWTLIAGAVAAYLILMFFLHKIFEKFFMVILFLVSTLFVVGVLYFYFKGL